MFDYIADTLILMFFDDVAKFSFDVQIYLFVHDVSAREVAVIDLEERQKKEKNQLAELQLKNMFILKRSLMMTRHGKVSLLIFGAALTGNVGSCICVVYEFDNLVAWFLFCSC